MPSTYYKVWHMLCAAIYIYIDRSNAQHFSLANQGLVMLERQRRQAILWSVISGEGGSIETGWRTANY